MFIDRAINSTLALQRSVMFSRLICEVGCVPLLRSEEIFWSFRFYKDYGPTGRGRGLELVKKTRG